MNKIKLRRIKKRFSNNKPKILLFLVVIIMLFMGIGYAIPNVVMNINGSAKIVVKESTCSLDVTTSFNQQGAWGDNSTGNRVYNVVISVTNNSADPIIGWEIKIKGPSDINIWANAIVTIDDSVATLTDMSWNGTIESGKTMSLDFSIITVEMVDNIEEILDYITFNGCSVYKNSDVEVPDYNVELKSIQINPSEYKMTVGETAQLQVEKTPSNAAATFTWSSSDDSIVSVTDDGIITAHATGDAIITASSGNISATSNITVSELTSLTIDPIQYTMSIGDTLALKAIKTPANANVELVWSSNNSSVASVDDSGLVTALTAGKAIIKVSADGISGLSTITVIDGDNPPSSDIIDIKYSTSYDYDREIHFNISFTNDSDSDITSFSFVLGMPEGTEYVIWSNPGVTILDNTFNFNLWSTLKPGATAEITGKITLPEGYSSSDYLSATIMDIEIN